MIENTGKPITWGELVSIEPALLVIEARLKEYQDDLREDSFCANAIWYGYPGYSPSYKMWMHGLVGNSAKKDNPRLTTCQAYDCAYQHLLNILPDCRNCGCLMVQQT